MDNVKRKIMILALGGGGCRMMNEFVSCHETAQFELLAVDSDLEGLQSSGLPEDRWLQAGRLLRSGRGCGGDIISGQQALANERKQLSSLLAGIDVLIVVAGLGGGLASGGMPVILGVAAKLHITTAVLVTLPFNMEGFQKRQLADDKVKNDILPIADAVIALPNDLLFTSLEANVAIFDAYRKSDQEMSRALFALASLLGGANLFNADFAAFAGVMKRRHTLCALGTAAVEDGVDAASRLMDNLLVSPLLGGPETFDTADAVMFSLLGGPELSLGTARAVLDLCSRQIDQEQEKKVLLGAATGEEFAGKLLLAALAVRYLDSPAKSSGTRKRTFIREEQRESSGAGEQLFLDLEVENKGIMENTTPVVIDGEDLDIPAFRRRNMVVDMGK